LAQYTKNSRIGRLCICQPWNSWLCGTTKCTTPWLRTIELLHIFRVSINSECSWIHLYCTRIL